MITHVAVWADFVHLDVACTNAEGESTDPSSAQAIFYRVSDVTGSIYRYTPVGSSGVITLSKQDSQTGFYGAAVDVNALEVGQYVVFFKVTIDGINAIGIDYLALYEDPHLRACVANAVYANSADTITVNAWLVDHGNMVTAPVDCTFTLYDDSGSTVFSALFSDSADANGVFRLTKTAPGLAYDKSYYGKVEIYDGFGAYSSLVGLVTVE